MIRKQQQQKVQLILTLERHTSPQKEIPAKLLFSVYLWSCLKGHYRLLIDMSTLIDRSINHTYRATDSHTLLSEKDSALLSGAGSLEYVAGGGGGGGGAPLWFLLRGWSNRSLMLPVLLLLRNAELVKRPHNSTVLCKWSRVKLIVLIVSLMGILFVFHSEIIRPVHIFCFFKVFEILG